MAVSKQPSIRRRLIAAALLLVPVLALRPRAQEPLEQLRELPVPALPGAGEQNLAVGPGGRIYLSWIDPEADSNSVLRFAVLGNAWSRPRTIAQGRGWFVNWADFPALAGSGSTLVAHWLERSGRSTYAYDIRMVRSSDGGATWSTPVTPHRDQTASEHGFVSLWPQEGGAVAAVWVDGRRSGPGGGMNLRTATLSASGDLSDEVELDDRICDCCQTAVALTSDGPIVVYRDRTADEIRDIAVVRLVNGAWTASAKVADEQWRINACPVNGPAVAAQRRDVAVAWFTAAGGTRRVEVAFSADAGASFGTPAMVDDGHPVGRVGIIMLDDGAALVSWLEDTGAGAEVRVRRVSPTGERGTAQTVARTASGRPSGFPRMARAGDRVVFAWRDPEQAGGARIHSAVARLAAGNR
jgi:hypothetical protein